MKLTDDEVALAERMLADGASLRAVERALGRTRNSMKTRFAGMGWTKVEGGARSGYVKRMSH